MSILVKWLSLSKADAKVVVLPIPSKQKEELFSKKIDNKRQTADKQHSSKQNFFQSYFNP